MTDLLVIANGRLQPGVSAQRWPGRLREIFGNGLEIYFTTARGDATRKAREALRAGVAWLAAAGGDGTIHEVVNGYFDKGRNIRPESPLSFIPCGTGNDWVRTLGSPLDPLQAAASLPSSHIREVDVGLARFRGVSGGLEERVFLNIAEAGVGGKLIAQKRREGGQFSGRLGYRLGALAAALSFEPISLRLTFEREPEVAVGPVLSLIVANGRHFGAGMRCAPMARTDDALLEAITIGKFTPLELLLKIGTLFSGAYLREKKVCHRQVHAVEAVSDDGVFLQLDGELAGTLPASFSVLPSSLQIRY